jgi:hypothetical protein
METKNCKDCGLTNPITSEVCDCGFVFQASSEETFKIAEWNLKKTNIERLEQKNIVIYFMFMFLRVILNLIFKSRSRTFK